MVRVRTVSSGMELAFGERGYLYNKKKKPKKISRKRNSGDIVEGWVEDTYF